MQTLVARVHEDLAATNAHRTAMQLPRYPPLTTAWTMRASSFLSLSTVGGAELTRPDCAQT